jgi:hypothetical protein
MIKLTRISPLSCATIAAFIISANASIGWANDDGDHDEIPFDEAHIFFELNNTDGDLGIHGKIDGDAWKHLKIEAPDESQLLNARIQGPLKKQGMTEFFFESAEPTFDELSPEDFFARFPEGIYEIEGLTLDKKELESETLVTHTMPAPAEPLVNGQSAALQCDDEKPGYDATLTGSPVTISWAPVTMSHPDPLGGGAGVQPPIPVFIINYEVVVETTIALANGEEFDTKFSAILPPDTTEMTIPEEFISLGDEFKYEVLAREESYNQTAVESCFVLE